MYNIYKDSGVWGALYKQGNEYLNFPHYNFGISSFKNHHIGKKGKTSIEPKIRSTRLVITIRICIYKESYVYRIFIVNI